MDPGHTHTAQRWMHAFTITHPGITWDSIVQATSADFAARNITAHSIGQYAIANGYFPDVVQEALIVMVDLPLQVRAHPIVRRHGVSANEAYGSTCQFAAWTQAEARARRLSGLIRDNPLPSSPSGLQGQQQQQHQQSAQQLEQEPVQRPDLQYGCCAHIFCSVGANHSRCSQPRSQQNVHLPALDACVHDHCKLSSHLGPDRSWHPGRLQKSSFPGWSVH